MGAIETISAELAYIAGAVEDTYLGTNKEKGYEFDMESKSKQWLECAIAPRLAKLTEKLIKVRKRTTRPYYRIRIWNKKLVTTLVSIKEMPTQVLKWSDEFQLLWVRGFIDAEGSVTKSGDNQPMLSVYNKNLQKLKIIEKILYLYDIKARYYKPSTRDVWQQYYTGRSNLSTLSETVNIEHPEKSNKLRLYL
ncbi:MAG: LAGLIDADG family homing endonuclease [Promethearchaeota archaeon]